MTDYQIEVDSFYTKGYSHEECQDYATTHKFVDDRNQDQYIATIADGCSRSFRSDVGARMLALSSMGKISSLPHNYVTLTHQASLLMDNYMYYLGGFIGEFSWDSTLFVARTIYKPTGELGGIQVQITGNGFILARRREDLIWDVLEIEYPSGSPAYLSYFRNSIEDKRRWKEYVKQELGHRLWKFYSFNKEDVVAETVQEDVVETMEQVELAHFYNAKDYDLVLIASDGLSQFDFPNQTKLDLKDYIRLIINHVLCFNSFKEEFIKSRINRFFSKEIDTLGWRISDDISISGFYIGEES